MHGCQISGYICYRAPPFCSLKPDRGTTIETQKSDMENCTTRLNCSVQHPYLRGADYQTFLICMTIVQSVSIHLNTGCHHYLVCGSIHNKVVEGIHNQPPFCCISNHDRLYFSEMSIGMSAMVLMLHPSNLHHS